MEKNCPKCGFKNNPNASLCNNCGANLAYNSEATTSTEPISQQNDGQPSGYQQHSPQNGPKSGYQQRPQQGGYQASTPSSMPPKNYLVESILVTLFCCLPFGIAGIVNASKVDGHFYSGRIAEAEKASADAKKWTKVAFWVFILIYAVPVFFAMFIALLGM